MKSLLTLSLLLSLSACSVKDGASVVNAAQSSSEDEAPSLIKKYGYDQVLNVNLDQFRRVAREELSQRFGKIADQGEIIHKDMVGENAGTFFDMNRLYYVAKVEIDPRLINGQDLFAAYMLTTQGYKAVGYARVTKDGRHDISWLFAGYAIGYKDVLLDEVDADGEHPHDEAKEEQILTDAVKTYAAAFPSLTFKPFTFINTFFAETPKANVLNPTAQQLEEFGKFLDMTRKDENVKYIEIQPEYANFMPADHISSFGEGEGKVIDMNALRSISLTFLREGNTPVNGLVPFLPKPFGDGVEKHIED
jgi:hypothetical protein